MWPELLSIEAFGHSITIHSYGLLISWGALAWLILAVYESYTRGLIVLAERMGWILLAMVFAAWVGGKLLYILIYSQNPMELFTSPGKGFVYYGSMLAVIPAAAGIARLMRLPPLTTLDVLLAPAPLLHVFGRSGCFLAGCCYGRPCDLPWAVTFRDGVGVRGIPIHPVQLYEAAGELTLFLLIWFWVRRKQTFDGQIALTYVFGYALLRILTEQFRGNQAESAVIGVTPSTLISLCLLLVVVCCWRRLRPDPST